MRKSSKNQKSRTVTGLVKRHPDGFGFLVTDTPGDADVYIPRNEMTGIMANDRLEVRVFREPGGNRTRGEVEKVIGRAVKRATGVYESRSGGRGLLRDKSFAWGADLAVNNPLGLNVRDGEWVSVDILTYPDSPDGFTGKLVAVIGDAMDPINDSVRVLHSANIPHEFSAKALAEADRLPAEVTEADMRGRKDLRSMPFVTIDGKTAKDFDDAICVEASSGGFKLWVAIADVSHYVKPDTEVDDEAYVRGTSTYFPNFVAPMLPEKLSNELCSLKPKVPRLAFVAEMDLDFQGVLTGSQFYEAVIESKARVTYGEAQEVIDGQVLESLKHVAAMIRRAGDLAKILMTKRFREGSLDLEIPETIVELDDSGVPVDILQSERLFAHRLIEELMLMANIAVARACNAKGAPCLFRIHEEPNPDAMASLQAFLATLGSQKSLKGGGLQKKITRALEDFSGHAKEHILHVLTLRSMAQARYSAHNVGHFGLGFADYAHFTSPIRRYPDLIVHRQLKAALRIGRGYELRSEDDLESAGTFLSACEQRSVKAERQIKAIKKARFMHAHLGEEFDGMISSVTKFGLFVILRQFDVDGLIRLEDLPGDRFEFDEENMRLVGRKSGRALQIGDPIKIVVAAANIDEGRVDFLPAGEEKRHAHDKSKKNQPAEECRPAQKNSQHFRAPRFPQRGRKGKSR